MVKFCETDKILATLGCGEESKTISFSQLHIVKKQISKRFGQPFGQKVTKSAILYILYICDMWLPMEFWLPWDAAQNHIVLSITYI